MGIQQFELKDHLNHHKYKWPKSLVRYPLQFERGEAFLNSLVLNDAGHQKIPFQIIVDLEEDGYLLEGRLCFIADLPKGAHHRYELRYDSDSSKKCAVSEDNQAENGSQVMTVEHGEGLLRVGNGELQVQMLDGIHCVKTYIAEEAPAVFALSMPLAGEQRLATAMLNSKKPLLAIESSVVSTGQIFHEQRICFQFEGEASYIIKLRLTVGMPFAEMEEEMIGIGKGEMNLKLNWGGLNPDRRYSLYRGEEPIDAYLNEDGGLPFRLLPYDNARSWHRCRTATFTDAMQGVETGIFHGNAANWNDGEYALWRSSDTLAIRFKYEPVTKRDQELTTPFAEDRTHQIVWTYPLASGTRSTMIAIYGVDKSSDRRMSEKPFNEYDSGKLDSRIDELALWHSFLPLDKVKDWVLDWEEPQDQYPLLFKAEDVPPRTDWWYFSRYSSPVPSDMEEIIEKLSFCFNSVYHTSPVTSREFASWVPIFDLSAGQMTEEQFKRFRAASAFMAYVREDEHVAPIYTMLAGHPNFLMDYKAVPGYMASLFPNHPHARRWVDHFERTIALSLKYHTRPAVMKWAAEGGRWTENLGCYIWAALVPMVKTAWSIQQTFGLSTLLHPRMIKFVGWLLNSLSAPLAKGRSYPPQGAHSGVHEDPLYTTYALRVLGIMLKDYSPALSEQLLSVCPKTAAGFEAKGKGDIWRRMLKGDHENNEGTLPSLRSSKYTGYGFILRSAVNTPSEMSVHIQQIDEGPNYRWGRSGDGGNGVIYYYAEGKRYSYNRPEDVGDDNMGTGEGSSTFAVLEGHEYKSIGRNELTAPLHNFEFAQFVTLHASEHARPLYKSRSVLMSGNDYIAIFDEVGDMRVRGRFSWFTQRNEDFPNIYQLKPGAAVSDVDLAGPVDSPYRKPGGYHRSNMNGYPDGSKGKYYDGFGHFLTIVTHRGTWQPQLTEVKATSFGAIVALCGRIDYLFRDASRIRYDQEGLRFEGLAGIIRKHDENSFEAAIFQGKLIGAGGIVATLASAGEFATTEQAAAFSFMKNGNVLKGKSSSHRPLSVQLELTAALTGEDHKLHINGEYYAVAYTETESGKQLITFDLPQGEVEWQWTAEQPTPGRIVKLHSVATGTNESDIQWNEIRCAERYQLAISEDGCRAWQIEESALLEPNFTLRGYGAGTKLHVKVRALNNASAGEWSEPHAVYVTDQPPHYPDGLSLNRTADGVVADWGYVHGAQLYRLYRTHHDEGGATLIYEGVHSSYRDTSLQMYDSDTVFVYHVTAVNGNGESLPSPARDTKQGGFIDWDPKPEEGFRRYVRSHEYGFNGFHYWENERKGSLAPYPQ